MTTFDDLTPPTELVQEWENKYHGHMPEWGMRHVAHEAASWGAERGYAIGKQEWPEPITDRPPTEADGDEDGYVQFFTHGHILFAPWNAYSSCAWRHTLRWQPPRSPTDPPRHRIHPRRNPTMTKTIRVRIAVSVDPTGDWSSAGFGGKTKQSDDELRSYTIDTLEPGETTYFLEADLPIPETQTIQAEVKP